MNKGKPANRSKKRPAGGSRIDRVIAAVDAFRRGRSVVIQSKAKLFLAQAVETANENAFVRQKGLKPAPRMVLTHARATTLKIRLYTPDVVALPLPGDLSAEESRAIADPTADLAYPLKGPFESVREKLDPAYAASVKLAKLAGLLPATIIRGTKTRPRGTVLLKADDINGYEDEVVRTLMIAARARVPLKGAERTELVSFRPSDGGPEHYAVIINAPPTSAPVLTRLHSECFTGDLLDSLKCDCGSQLRGAIDVISKEGGGILLYLAQEGRGIGLINKLRSYRLQDQGFDTIEANERLGFEADERLYGIAARMLDMLGYRSVRLLTNNPDKVAALKSHGVKVVERVRHAFPENLHNRAYLKTKASKAGHLF